MGKHLGMKSNFFAIDGKQERSWKTDVFWSSSGSDTREISPPRVCANCGGEALSTWLGSSARCHGQQLFMLLACDHAVLVRVKPGEQGGRATELIA